MYHGSSCHLWGFLEAHGDVTEDLWASRVNSADSAWGRHWKRRCSSILTENWLCNSCKVQFGATMNLYRSCSQHSQHCNVATIRQRECQPTLDVRTCMVLLHDFGRWTRFEVRVAANISSWKMQSWNSILYLECILVSWYFCRVFNLEIPINSFPAFEVWGSFERDPSDFVFGFLEPISQSLELAFVERWRAIMKRYEQDHWWLASCSLVKFEESLLDKHPKVSLCIFRSAKLPMCVLQDAPRPGGSLRSAKSCGCLNGHGELAFSSRLDKYRKFLDAHRMQAVCSRGTVLQCFDVFSSSPKNFLKDQESRRVQTVSAGCIPWAFAHAYLHVWRHFRVSVSCWS